MSLIFKMGSNSKNIVVCIEQEDWFMGWDLWFKFFESNDQADRFFRSSLIKLATDRKI